MKMLTKWKKYISVEKLFNKGQTILLAVSGGLDSMCLMYLMKEINQPIVIAHCNFKLRGLDADEDEMFVKNEAEKLKLPFFSTSFETKQYAKKHKVSIQMAARELRYDWFEKIRKEQGCNLIATAHHMNDNAETLLLNLSRGAGISGSRGIMSKNDKIVRPLLNFTRAELEQYATEQNIEYRNDASNDSLKYERNYIRHQVIPVMEKQAPDFVQKLNDFTRKMNDAETIYRAGIKNDLKKLLMHKHKAQYMPIVKLQQYTYWRTLLFEWLSPFGFNENEVKGVGEILDSLSGKEIKNENYRVLKDRKFLILCDNEIADYGLTVVSENQKAITIGNKQFTFKKGPKSKITLNQKIDYAFLDIDKLEFPLLIRPWQKGDYFYPLGMNKKKKVSDFFQDQKLNTAEKENTFLLFSGEKLAWVCGHRIDERFKVNASTKQVLKVRIKSRDK